VPLLVGRLNRPGLMVYGGTIRAGSCAGLPQLDIVSAFQSYGKFIQDGRTPAAEKERYNTVRHACPGPGACGGVGISMITCRDGLYTDDVVRRVDNRCIRQTQWQVLPNP
jgi:dihydroxyacid dehydratase/phosphogluconate dehydratase